MTTSRSSAPARGSRSLAHGFRRRRGPVALGLGVLLTVGCGGGGGGDDHAAASTADATRARILAVSNEEAARARWSAPVTLSIVPAAGMVQADGKLMFWSGDGRMTFGGNGHTWTTLFDPATNTATERDVTETGHDMFCPGTARLPDGRLLVSGGLDNTKTSLYDPVTRAWSAGPAMNIARGYNASTPLPDGSVLTLGGSWNFTGPDRDGEVFTVTGGWRRLTGVPVMPFLLNGTYQSWQNDSHFNLIPSGNGRVLYAGPAVDMLWIDPRGNGAVMPAGLRGDDGPAFSGNTVMFDAGKILKTGGARWNSSSPASATAYVIDTSAGRADVQKLAPMAYPRVYANSVVLPNGQVVVIGGQTYVQEFSDNYAVLAPELFDPATGRFVVLPAMTKARNYHSIATLLPDARVVSAGGGLCGCVADHPDLEILSPPYLFNADGSAAARPVITGAPTTLAHGSTVEVQTDSPVTAFSLVRLGAVTHTVNNDQRRLSLAFAEAGGNRYQVSVPSNPGWLLPGQWMLFAMNAAGTPSVARIVTVDLNGTPTLENPGSVVLTRGQSSWFPLTSGGGTLAFTAANLPDGLTIDPATGAIWGTPTTAGSRLVTVTATANGRSISTDFLLDVTAAGTGTGLLAQYFANTTLSGSAAAQRTEVPNFDWGSGSPAGGVPADNFSARWLGEIEAVATGAARFYTNSSDGVRVWIGNQLVIDHWNDHTSTGDYGSFPMVAGQRYPILIEYYERSGSANVRLEWQPPNASWWEVVPAQRLYPGGAPSTRNVAAGRAAAQSSTATGGAAGNATDGNTTGAFTAGSVSLTASELQPWWQVDLGSNANIDLVQLWNRSDCCSELLQNFEVFVAQADMRGRTLDALRTDPAVVRRIVGASTVVPSISLPVGAVGRFVRVQAVGSTATQLALAEVQVWGQTNDTYHTPTINSVPAQRTEAGTPVSLAVTASDPDGNALVYTASGLPPGLVIEAPTGRISGTPTTAGTYAVTLRVTNAGNLSASTGFGWTVLDAVPAVVTLAAPVAASGSTVNYAPTMSAGANAQYSWRFGDGSADTPWSASTAASHAYVAPGVYDVTLSIVTADGRTATYGFVQAIYPAGPSALASASSNLLLEPRSGAAARLWVANPDNDTVSVFDTGTRAKLAEIAVGSAPRSLARAPDGRIWVVNQRGGTISVISQSSFAIARTVTMPRASQPYGLVFASGGAFVALEATGELRKLNASTGAAIATLAVGPNPRHLAASGDGARILVSRFVTPPLPGESTAAVATTRPDGTPAGGELLSVDAASLAIERSVVLAHSERADSEISGRGFPNYLGAAAIAPNGLSAWVPSKQDNLRRGLLRDGQPLNFQNTVRAISSRLDLGAAAAVEVLADRIDHDNASVASAAVYHPTGAYLFVALETSRQVAVVDVAGRREVMRFEADLAPQGLAVSPDGLKLYVHNVMARSVGEIDLVPLVGFGRTAAPAVNVLATVGTEKLAAQVLRGKQLFYDARDPRLARDAYMSCATCHHDGRDDGRTWDMTGFGEGLRNTIALRGRAAMGHGFLHWSANFDELQDFEGQIRNFAGGTGLMSDADFTAGTRSQPLGAPKAGLSADLDALAAYVASLSTFDTSPARRSAGALTTAAQAGKTVFTQRNCAACHGGTAFTTSSDASGLRDVGTLRASSGQRLGGPLAGIDVPTLRDVGRSAPYLHDGRAATVTDAILAHDANTLGGTLDATSLANLGAFVLQIGSEESAAPSPYTTTPVAGSTSAGSAFTDGVAAGQRVTGVTVRTGSWVYSVQALATPANLPRRGGTGGTATTVTLAPGENIIRVYGFWSASNNVIARISFQTSSGRVFGPYGTGTGVGTLTPYDFWVPQGRRMLGFTGRSGTNLHAIGLVYGF